jgi:mannose/fructose/N-acetylgalactosamine-specific phosphotransferase system component IIC
MTEVSLTSVGLLLAWGTVVGVDLVSVPQGLLSRPLIAAAVAGWLLGDIETGLRVGALLELFALDVLPVGASRYPEYGPAAIGAVLLTAGLPAWGGVGVGALLGLLVAMLAGYSLEWLRHANARDVHRRSAELDAGSAAAVRRLQWSGLARDALRGLAVTAVALALAWVARARLGGAVRLPEYLTPVLVGVGLAAALSGALRTAGRGRRLAWLGVGLAAGVVLVLVVAA